VTDKPDRQIADMDGPAALPRKNGELVFNEAWEGRIFGMAVAMSEGQQFDWEDFRQQLIAEIASEDQAGSESTYFERWLAAFERLLDRRGLIKTEELESRTAELESGARDDVF
jgi:nitrile hydratase accessory protein